jgi:hypothetical protein
MKTNRIGWGFTKWFELNLGWFFVNGRKQDSWTRYLKKKYGEKDVL